MPVSREEGRGLECSMTGSDLGQERLKQHWYKQKCFQDSRDRRQLLFVQAPRRGSAGLFTADNQKNDLICISYPFNLLLCTNSSAWSWKGMLIFSPTQLCWAEHTTLLQHPLPACPAQHSLLHPIITNLEKGRAQYLGRERKHH